MAGTGVGAELRHFVGNGFELRCKFDPNTDILGMLSLPHKKFILLYVGSVVKPEMITDEQAEASDSVRTSWIENIGDALIDVGARMTKGKALVDDGSITEAANINGYTIIQAENIDEALKLIDGNPFLMDKTGDFRVEVFELTPSTD